MRFLFSLFLIVRISGVAQNINFDAHYNDYPLIPKGLIEAVSFSNTRMQLLDPSAPTSCTGMPQAYGILGLFDANTPYFKPNGELIATLSGISVLEQKENVYREIEAYAHAFHQLMTETGATSSEEGEAVYTVLSLLSEIPDSGKVNLFARDAQIFQIFKFLNDYEKASDFNLPLHQYDLANIFGAENLSVLNAPRIRIQQNEISSVNGNAYEPTLLCRSVNYGPAIWTPAASCNFSSRSGTAISAITIHTVQGTYAGCISWFQNCSASVSAHYVIRSSDGQVTQMVDEADKAWHVGSENPYTIGYEHEGYVNNASWYTEAMYSASAALSRDIVASGYGMSALRTYFGTAGSVVNVVGNCTKIKGHQHYPNQTHTDPGINWNWEKYYRLINDNPTIQSITTTSGSFYDSGGQASNYTDDERKIWVFEPSNATSITLDFTSFNLENNWDFLFLYDGNSIDAPLIGKYTGTTGPSTITSSGGSITVEFRSDCATTSPGWEVSYSSATIAVDDTPPTTLIAQENGWRTQDFTTSITDSDLSSVTGKYFLISDKDPVAGIWSANSDLGFAEELFDVNMDNWTAVTGPFALSNNAITCTDAAQTNSNCYLNVVQDAGSTFLYTWDQTFTSTLTNQRAGLHFFCDDPTLPNRGNSYFVFLRETDNVAQIYKVVNDTWTLVSSGAIDVLANVSYPCKVTYEPTSGWIKYYINDSLTVQWQDPEPLQSGNSISLRTAGCTVAYDNIRVYKSRGQNISVSVGPNGHMRHESLNAQPTGRIRSLALDLYENWSLEQSEDYLIDWSIPELTFLNDGPSSTDIDTITTAVVEGNWLAVDPHSAIETYEIAIGTLPSINDVMDWTDLGATNVFSQILSTTDYGTTYHIGLRVKNGAGLTDLFVSDGQKLVDPNFGLGMNENDFSNIYVYPNPANETLYVNGLTEEITYTVFDATGKIILTDSNSSVPVSHWAAGVYTILFQSGNAFYKERFVVK